MASVLNDVDKAQIQAQVRDEVRAAVLGLVPEKDGTVSERGEYIIEPSNIEELENKKMRGYRYVEYGTSGKMLHAWPEGSPEPTALIVYNRAEEEKAVALGWSVDPVHGPGGKLGVAASEPVAPTVVRDFAAPGQPQPFEQPADEDADAPAPRRGRPRKSA